MEEIKIIHLNEANTLSKFLSKEERQTIVSLKITGVIGDKDFNDVLDDMCSAEGIYDEDDDYIIDYEDSPVLRNLDMGEAAYVDGDSLPEFGYHSLLETLIIPNNIQKIEYDAGLSESQLQTLVLPQGLKTIGGFMSCPNLTNIVLPEGVEEILPSAFGGCNSITEIRIPASVKSMDGSCFAGCNIKAYEVDSNNPYFTTVDGVIFNKDLNTLVAFPSAYPHKHYKIPDTTKSIGFEAFSEARIESVDIPEGLLNIGEWAFEFSMVRNVNMPDSVKEIGKGAFRHCYQLEKIHLSNKLEEIPTLLFSSCPKLAVLDIPPSVHKLYYSAVAWSGGLERLILHDGLEEIVDEGPMLGCGGKLYEVTIPNTLEKVQGGLFNYSPLIKSYHVAPDNPYFCVIKEALYSKDGKILYAVPNPERSRFSVAEGTEEIAERAFFSLPKLRTVILPHSLHVIGDRAFQACSQLESLRLPANVTSVGVDFLLSCDNLKTVIMDGTVPPQMTGHVTDDMWIYKNIELLVPKGSIAEYKKAPGWKTFIIKEQ